MSPAIAAVILIALAQAPASSAPDPGASAIAPFVDSDVFAVLQVDVGRLDAEQLSARIFGDPPPGVLAEGKNLLLAWSQGLKAAGARELFVCFSILDMPGQPFIVVPLGDGSRAETIARTIHAEPTPIRGAIVSGTPEALERIRRAAPPSRPELAAAFAAVSERSKAVRFILLPSAESRRVIEELVPRFPAELGGGPVTDLTHGLIWAAATIENADKPTLKLVAASRDAESARSLVRLGEKAIGFLRKSPDIQAVIPDLGRVLPDFEPVLADNRVNLTLDAHQAAALAEALLSPARKSANRGDCVNNLKRIVLGMHNYHTKHESFPPAYSSDKDKKPLLSWRVLILPYLDQQALHDQFHLDEPWDSAHNRTLISKMPEIYRCPEENEALSKAGKTRYLAPRGAGTIMRGAEPVRLRDIADGTSNTIIALDAGDGHAVEWTKPADWEFDPEPGIEAVFKSHEPPGSNFAFADGSVRYLSATIPAATLRALLTRDGAEVIRAEDL